MNGPVVLKLQRLIILLTRERKFETKRLNKILQRELDSIINILAGSVSP